MSKIHERLLHRFREIHIKGRRQSDVAREEGISPGAMSQYIKRHQADWEELKQEYKAHLAQKTEWEQQVDALHDEKKEILLWQTRLKNPTDNFIVGVLQAVTSGEYNAEMERGPFGKHKEYILYTRDGDDTVHGIEKDKFTPDLLKGGDSQSKYPPGRVIAPTEESSDGS